MFITNNGTDLGLFQVSKNINFEETEEDLEIEKKLLEDFRKRMNSRTPYVSKKYYKVTVKTNKKSKHRDNPRYTYLTKK